ncbi:SAE2-domain-containing protein [Pseudovirgaria hyperparasitica]|uniref:SAE2-domain-containing protein n=1 Tax=Pseudovirgaria hyperparasitica TaxID=470096 RepID=A0A6A6VY69_9PEZI|nr:SAE2-domain-containing protein [Pseudovirgaria hyperparasitica]KAF2755203.1 SAE2-domain-containing protein [Pseudovirgaria hyperparasitica]
MENDVWWLEEQCDLLSSAINQHVVDFHQTIKRKLSKLPSNEAHEHAQVVNTLENKVSTLTAENEALKQKIAALSSTSAVRTSTGTPARTDTPEEATPGTRFENLYVPYSDWQHLSQKYNEHRNKYNDILKSSEMSRQNREKAKESIRDWQTWIMKKDLALKKREQRIREKELALSIKTEALPNEYRPQASTHLQSSLTPSASRGGGIIRGNLFQTSKPMPLEDLQGSTRRGERYLAIDQLGSSQTTTTQDENIEEPLPAQDLLVGDRDHDIPEFVFERPVKRKRSTPRKTRRSLAQPSPIRIKDEPSSPPSIVAAQQTLTRMDTLDLDEAVQDISTPRKRRRLELLRISQLPSFRATAMNNLRQQRSNSLPRDVITEPQKTEARGEGSSSPENSSIKAEDRSNSEPRSMGGTRRLPFSTQHSPRNFRGPLSEVSPNIEHGRPTRKNSGIQEGIQDQSGYHVHILCEDGEERFRPQTKGSWAEEEPSARGDCEAQKRLDALLASQKPDHLKSPTISRPASTAKPRSRIRLINHNNTAQPSTKTETPASPQPVTPLTTRRYKGEQTSTTTHSAKRPLRSRPLSELSASDFRLNPKTNEGLDFAFSDTVRDSESRRCLPGCTKPSCCGKAFRALVEAGVQPKLPRSLFEASQDASKSSQEEEERLLRHYLGDAYRHDMTMDYRAEMLLSARAQLLANQHGKHRQQHERRSSPPGYWDTDFPSTQELDRRGEEARKRDQAIVEERWREAMREGGRWVFKDEK